MAFKIFISSPVDGIEEYREEIIRQTRDVVGNEIFEFFFYELQQIDILPNKTITESIFEKSGKDFDALFVFFKDRVGSGTIEELDYFENVIISSNENCQIWWTQIDCDHSPNDVQAFKARLLGHNLGLPKIGGHLRIASPSMLGGVFTAKLWSLVSQLRPATT